MTGTAQDPASGWWVYAKKDGGTLAPTNAVAGKDDPARLGLSPGLMPDASAREAVRTGQSASPSDPQPAGPPRTGHIDNLVLFIRFADDTEFPASRPVYESLFNGPDGNPSMRGYFQEVSYGKLDVLSWLVPEAGGAAIVSYQDSHPRGYYLPYNATTNPIGYNPGSAQSRERTLLFNALASTAASLPETMHLDANGDGYLDHVTFVMRGTAGPWSSVLWPHMGALPLDGQLVNGVKPGTYSLQIEDVLLSGNLGTLCHEFFHGLGAPDLYHYVPNGIDPVGVWDLMGVPARIPQHMGAFMKWKYGGWIDDIPSVVAAREYHLKPLTSPDTNSLRINSTVYTTEYYVVEYRRRTGVFESSLLGDGLLVYRIDPLRPGNMFGPPDEVYIYRPGGTLTANGTLRDAPYSAESGRTSIHSTTLPFGFLGDRTDGGLHIEGIGSAGDTISFTIHTQEWPRSLQFLTQPGDLLPGQPFDPCIRVAARDPWGHVAVFNGPVTISLETGGGTSDARLLGGTTAAALDGVAAFLNLAVDSAGANFRLRASSPGMEDILSVPFGTAGNGVTQTTRVNLARTGKQSIGPATEVAISADGSRVAFVSKAYDLTTWQIWGYRQVFQRDVGSGVTRCASTGTTGEAARANCMTLGMSSDGRCVTFVSSAANLVAGDTNYQPDFFWRDTQRNITRIAVTAFAPTKSPAISADGRFVAYGRDGIFVYDAQTDVIEPVSRTTDGSFATGCQTPGLSADGRFVAFESSRDHLVENITTPARWPQIYVLERVTGKNRSVTLTPIGAHADGPCGDAAISRDGRFVAFSSSAGNLIPGVPTGTTQVYVRDMTSNGIVCASVGVTGTLFAEVAGKPTISGDGTRVAFQATGLLPSDPGGRNQVFVRDLRLGKALLASCSGGGTAGNDESADPKLSDDGRWVAYVSSADNLVPDDTNGALDAFLRGPLVSTTLADAARALRIVAGLSAATAGDTALLPPLAHGLPVTLADVMGIVQRSQGL